MSIVECCQNCALVTATSQEGRSSPSVEHHRSFCRAPAQPYTPALPLARADSARWIDTMGDSEACRWWRGGLSSPAPGPVGRVACGASRWRAQQRFRRSRLGLLEYWRGRALAAPRGALCVRAKWTKGVVGEVWIMAIDTPYTRVVIDWTDAVGSWDCSSQARKPRGVARKR